MGATPTLPVLAPATRAVGDQVADRLEAEATDLAATMTAAVIDEIPERAAATMTAAVDEEIAERAAATMTAAVDEIPDAPPGP
jgi:hypothetical protein